MSKARIRRVRAQRDALDVQLTAVDLDLRDALDALQEIRDLVGEHNPGHHDPTLFRDELWEIVRPPGSIV